MKQVWSKPALDSGARAVHASQRRRARRGRGAQTRVLWDADALAKNSVRIAAEVEALAALAKIGNAQPLNASQGKTVRAAAKNSLSVIWGPPGTGKTDMLVAFLHSVVREGTPRKILIAGL
jgi:hypothetical protein